MFKKFTRIQNHSRFISSFGRKFAKDEKKDGGQVSKEDKEECKTSLGPCDSPQKCTAPPAPNKGGDSTICIYKPCPPVVPKPCIPEEPSPESQPAEWAPPPGPRVLILGAGIAGLTAANQLVKGGINNVVILEADSRAGGRARSSWAEDSVVELGLGGEGKQPLSWDHPLLRVGLEDGVIPPPIGSDPTSGLLDSSIPLPVLFRTYTSMKHLGQEKEEARIRSPGYISLRSEQEGRRSSKDERVTTARIMAAISALISSKLKVQEDSFGAYAMGPGDAKVPLGEGSIVAPLIDSLGPDRILYQKEAVCIRWGTVTMSQSPRVIVRCRDGTEYPGEYLLITCSLGSLKKSVNTMFFPPLPRDKVQAIEQLEFLQANRAYLTYPEPFWVWAPGEVNLTFTKEECEARKGWSKGVKEIKQVAGSERTLEAVVSGPEAVIMERTPTLDVMYLIHQLMEEGLKVGKLPQPERIIRSKWSNPRFFAGLSSPDINSELRAELACPVPYPDPLPPVLLFGGEASAPEPSGLRGASLSGLREANRLIDIFAQHHSDEILTTCPIVCPT